MHGAVREAYHVFLSKGLYMYENQEVHILEIGFGTGLNALVSLLEAPSRGLDVHYTALEAYPVVEREWRQLEYGQALGVHPRAGDLYEKLHLAPWETRETIRAGFSLHKIKIDFLEFTSGSFYDIVYFDAFGARVQPELWTEAVFCGMYAALRPGGILVTYSAKGSVRRAMEAAGFTTERLPGPPGKREMPRAQKPV